MRFGQLAAPVLAVLTAAVLFSACTSDDGSSGSAESDGRLVGAGYSFGMCGSPCVGDLVIDGSRVSHVVRGNFDEAPLVENSGELTGKAEGIIQDFMDALGNAELQPVYGCPDCADGGAAYVTLRRNGSPSQHTYDFGRPPRVLAGFDDFGAAIMSALETCRMSELVMVKANCVPLQ